VSVGRFPDTRSLGEEPGGEAVMPLICHRRSGDEPFGNRNVALRVDVDGDLRMRTGSRSRAPAEKFARASFRASDRKQTQGVAHQNACAEY
jgi:hypothetical protein